MSSGPTFIQYGMFTSEQWRQIAVCEVTSKVPTGDASVYNTPSDPRMGVLENDSPCESCGHKNKVCPGHFGYIALDEPIYNCLMLAYIVKILNCVCPYCSMPRIKPKDAEIQGMLAKKGLKRFKTLTKQLANINRCPYDCERAMPGYFLVNEDIKKYAVIKGEKPCDSKKRGMLVTSPEVYTIFCNMTTETCSFLGLNSNLGTNSEFTVNEEHIHQFRPEAMLFVNLPVLPSCSRPYVVINGEKREDHLTELYNSIIAINTRLKEDRKGVKTKRRGGTSNTKYNRETDIVDLRTKIWSLINNQKNATKTAGGGGKAYKSIAERLIKKNGRIQGNIMAVRVDYSGRSVITGGGLLIPGGYVGVPMWMCTKLTMKELVQKWNIPYLQELLDSGQVPTIVRKGKEVDLGVISHKGRFLLQVGDIVNRFLQDGDPVLFNRQPSLRLESLRVFKVKRIQGLTLRFSVFETGPFNADLL